MNDQRLKPPHRHDPSVTVERRTDAVWKANDGLASCDEVQKPEPVLDLACQDELIALIGAHKVIELLAHLSEDLYLRFRSTSPEALRADAHNVVSTAGLLGFAALSAAALSLERTIEIGDDFAPALLRVIATRSVALQAIDEVSISLASHASAKHHS